MAISSTINLAQATTTWIWSRPRARYLLVHYSAQKNMGPFVDGDPDTTISLPQLGLNANIWCHVVRTFDGKEIRIYVNGKLEGKKHVDKRTGQ